MRKASFATLFSVLLLTASLFGAVAKAEVTLMDKDGWRFYSSGFIETDVINDSVRSFREVVGNTPIDQGNASNGNGANGRTQLSIRNSRLAFGAEAPVVNDWKSKGYFEFDLLGYDPSPATSSTATSASEGGFYTNPTTRIRHVYLQAESAEGWQVTAGQTWQLLGWQGNYFLTSVDVAPLPGMLYGRTEQVRLMKTAKLSDDNSLQMAVAVLRPPQSDAIYPDIQAGVRAAFGGRKSGYTGGSGAGTRKLTPMSLGVSGAYRQFSVPDGSGTVGSESKFSGYALAVDAFIPILAGTDDVTGTLSLVAEYSEGQGYGDQFSGWTGGTGSPLAAASKGPASAQTIKPNLDGGIGDYISSTTFELINLQSMNAHLQYHLPNHIPDWVDVGYCQLVSFNMDNFNTSGLASGGKALYNKTSSMFANYFHEFTPQIRAGLEYAQLQTNYASDLGNGSYGVDRRWQLSGYFVF